jgi:hypothetical protein
MNLSEHWADITAKTPAPPRSNYDLPILPSDWVEVDNSAKIMRFLNSKIFEARIFNGDEILFEDRQTTGAGGFDQTPIVFRMRPIEQNILANDMRLCAPSRELGEWLERRAESHFHLLSLKGASIEISVSAKNFLHTARFKREWKETSPIEGLERKIAYITDQETNFDFTYEAFQLWGIPEEIRKFEEQSMDYSLATVLLSKLGFNPPKY